jgi:hypothetical protein
MECPFCREQIKDGAIKCKHCGSMLDERSIEFQSKAAALNPPLEGFRMLCPFCQEEIKNKAIKCKHCKSMLNAMESDNTKPIKALQAKPQQIVLAVKLMYIVLAIGIVNSLIAPDIGHVGPLGTLLSIGVIILSVAFLARNISQGRNWARLAYVILCIIGLPVSVIALYSIMQISSLCFIISIVQTFITLYIMFLLLKKESKQWCRGVVSNVS